MKIYVNMLNITTGNNEWVLIKDDPLALGGGDNYRGIYRIFDENDRQIGVINNEGLNLTGPQGIFMKFSNDSGIEGYVFETIEEDGDEVERKKNLFWANDQEMGATNLNAAQIFDLGGRLRAIPMEQTGENNQIINRGVGIVAVQQGGN